MISIKKWYGNRSATEKGAIVSGVFLLIIALLTIGHQRSQLRDDNRRLEDAVRKGEADIRAISAERDGLKQRLAPFEAIAAKSFPNQEDRKRLDLLIQTIEELNKKYGAFEFRRADSLELTQEARRFAEEYQTANTNKPKVLVLLYTTASDASRRLCDTLRTTLLDAGWDVKMQGDFLQKPIERGIWIYTKNPKAPSKQQVFWSYLLVKFGLDVKIGYWSTPLGEDEVALVVNDPSYIR